MLILHLYGIEAVLGKQAAPPGSKSGSPSSKSTPPAKPGNQAAAPATNSPKPTPGDKKEPAPPQARRIYPELGHFPSPLDPIAVRKYPQLLNSSGFLPNHANNPFSNPESGMIFGNMAVASLNMHLTKDTLENAQEDIILKFIDTHHPTILSLQGVSEVVLKNVRERVNGHYVFAASSFIDIDKISMKREYKPILYDSRNVKELTEGPFKPIKPNQAYATFAIFQVETTGEIFTVINVDLYSIDAKTINTEMMVILTHFTHSGYKDRPVLLSGTINVIDKHLSKMFGAAFKNVILSDMHNESASSTTFHAHGKLIDDIPRDFIFLRDPGDEIDINYSRIIKNFNEDAFEHYPLYAVLTLKHKQPQQPQAVLVNK